MGSAHNYDMGQFFYYAILTTYIREDPRTCRGFSSGCCHVALSNGESCEILLGIFHSDCKEKGGK